MAALSKLVVELQLKDGVSPGLGKVQRQMGGFGRMLSGALSVAGGLGLFRVFDGIARGIGGVVEAGLDFESAMANVNSIAQLSAGQLKDLENSVIDIANNPAITDGPAQLAEGLYNIYSSGFQGADGLKILEASAMAATAGLTNTDTAAAAATAVLNAYGMKADEVGHVQDVLFQTVNDGVVTYEELAKNLGNTVPIAASLGVTIEELGAAYAQMTLKGVGASQAETQIAALMRSALNPTDALTAAVQAHGYASASAAIETEGLAGFLKILDDAAGSDKEALFALLGTQEAMNAATILGAHGAKDYVKEIDRMKRASEGTGATQRALAKQTQSAKFQLALARKELQVFGAVLMSILAPGILFVTENLAGLARGMAVFIHYIDMVLQGHSRWTKALDELPPGLRRAARGLGLVVDAIADTVRAFREGGLQAAFDELGRIQGDRLLGGLRVLGEEAWKAFSGAFTALAGAGLQLASIAVDVAGWAIGEIPDLWSWLMGAIGVTSGGFKAVGDGTEATQPVTLADVLVNVTSWAAGEIADLGDAIQGFVDDLAKPTVHLGGWTLTVPTPEIAFAGGFDLGQTVRSHLPAVRLSDWKTWTLVLGAPFVVPMAGVALGQAILAKLGFARIANFTKWALEVGAASAVGFAAGFGLGPAISKALGALADPTVPLPSWNLHLPDPNMPDLDFNRVFNWIWTKLQSISPSVPLDSWKLVLGNPEVSLGTDVDLAANILRVARDALHPLEIGGAGTGGKDDPFTFNANVTVDTSAAQTQVGDLKKSLTDFQTAIWTTSLDAEKTGFDRVLRDADTSGAGFENNPYVGILDGNRAKWDGVLWDAIQAGLGFQRTTFTTNLNADKNPFDNVMSAAQGELFSFSRATWSTTLSAIDNASGTIYAVIGLLNAIPRQVTSTINVNTVTSTTARATGGYVNEAVTLVGERGPELVSLPRGSYVHTAGQTRGMIAGGEPGGEGTTFNNYGTIHVQADDPRQFMDQMRNWGLSQR